MDMDENCDLMLEAYSCKTPLLVYSMYFTHIPDPTQGLNLNVLATEIFSLFLGYPMMLHVFVAYLPLMSCPGCSAAPGDS